MNRPCPYPAIYDRGECCGRCDDKPLTMSMFLSRADLETARLLAFVRQAIEVLDNGYSIADADRYRLAERGRGLLAGLTKHPATTDGLKQAEPQSGEHISSEPS